LQSFSLDGHREPVDDGLGRVPGSLSTPAARLAAPTLSVHIVVVRRTSRGDGQRGLFAGPPLKCLAEATTQAMPMIVSMVSVCASGAIIFSKQRELLSQYCLPWSR